MKRVRHVIACAVDQYAMARGMCDIEYTVCRMTNGKTRTFEDGDAELEAFFDDREKYWKTRGWKRVLVEGGWTLQPRERAIR